MQEGFCASFASMIKRFLLILCLLGSTMLYSQDKQPVLTPAQMHGDLDILKAAFTNLHPGAYRYINREQLNRYFKEAARATDRPLSLASYYVKLSQLAVRLRCGHTYVNPYNQKKRVTTPLLSDLVVPLLFQVIDNRLVITHNLSEQAEIHAGDEIVSINGVPCTDIVDSLLTVSRADGRNGLHKQLDNINLTPYLSGPDKYALFDIYFPLLFGSTPHTGYYNITVKPFKGKLVTYKVALITKMQRRQRYKERFFAAFNQPTGAFSWLAPQCGYLKIRDFSTKGWGGDYKQFLDSTFNILSSHKATHLVVDIRGNEGGDDGVRNKVISYLIGQPAYYGVRRYFRFLSVPDVLMPHLETWDPSFKKPKSAADFELTNDNLYYKKNSTASDTIIPNEKHFKGEIYLLTSATNSSSSFFMADILQQNKAAKLVGEATGGTKQGINGGQFFFLYLPSSGIEVDIPLIYQAPMGKRRDEGIQPDVEIKTKPRDIHNGTDPQLQYILRQLK
jgi:C-terminal processing protease CtpA/Prc